MTTTCAWCSWPATRTPARRCWATSTRGRRGTRCSIPSTTGSAPRGCPPAPTTGPATRTPTPRSPRARSAPTRWDPDDALLLPLRGATGEVLGMVSVDEPLSGRRPTDDEVRVLMAVADQAALAVEHVLVAGGGSGQAPSGEAPELRLAAAMLLAETLDLRDAGTAEHSRTVGQFARDTAAALGLAAARVDRLQAAGVLHDLGKLGIADAILHKPGSLTDAEWKEMTRHPEIGARILEHEIPTRGAHPRGRRRLRGDDRRPPLPARDAGRGGARGARALRGHAVRPDRGRGVPRDAARAAPAAAARRDGLDRALDRAPEALDVVRRRAGLADRDAHEAGVADARRRDEQARLRVDRPRDLVRGVVAVRVAEADEGERDGRDALQRVVRRRRGGRAPARARRARAAAPAAPARRSCAAPTTASARGSGARARCASRGSRSPRRSRWRRCAGTAGRSRACRSAACDRPPTARCSRSS